MVNKWYPKGQDVIVEMDKNGKGIKVLKGNNTLRVIVFKALDDNPSLTNAQRGQLKARYASEWNL